MSSPTVSVIVPVHNRAGLISAAIASILGQSFADFELVVVDDGSTDDSVDIVAAFADPRIRIIRHDRNRGIPDARNSGLEAAKGEFIAWLDSDDIARVNRLEEQVRFLGRHPEIAMVGCCAGKIREDGSKKGGIRVPPLEASDISAWLLFRSAFQQSSVMGRAAILKAYPYRRAFDVCEDLDVFVRMAQSHRLANLPQVLIDRRIHAGQTVRQRQERIRERKMELYAGSLERLGMTFSQEDLRRHALLGKTSLEGVRLPDDFLGWADGWMRSLCERSRMREGGDSQAMEFATAYFWVLACRVAIPSVGRAAALRAYGRSPLVKGLFNPHARAWLARTAPLLAGVRR